jgi:uncharacterized membrane protein
LRARLVGWNVLVWLYLAGSRVALRAPTRATSSGSRWRRRKRAIALGDRRRAAVMSLVAVVVELLAAKAAGPQHMLPHLVFAFVSVLGSWLLLPTLFGLTYASAYYGPEPDRGLAFRESPKGFEPDHTDFLYFSFTIAVTAQTSDVGVTTRSMRALVLAQSLLSFLLQHDDPGVLDQRRGELLLARASRQEQLRGAVAMAHDRRRGIEPALDEPGDRARIEAMLLREHARRERRLVVAGEHRHHRLGDDRPVVELGGDEMDARPARLAARLDRAPMRLEARERRQQRRMDVDEPAVEAAHEAGAEDAHEAGQRDDVGAVALDASASASSKASRLAKARWSTTSVAMPRSRANASRRRRRGC